MRVVAIMLAAVGMGAFAVPAAPVVALPSTGLYGVVMRGPIKPVCRESEPCDAPAAGVVLRFSRAGAVVARVKTNGAGRYSIKLRAGKYAVSTTKTGIGSGVSPATVRVASGTPRRVDFHIDTGIR